LWALAFAWEFSDEFLASEGALAAAHAANEAMKTNRVICMCGSPSETRSFQAKNLAFFGRTMFGLTIG
jgi:hypothetical protein